jgi:hypothetical protein
VVLRAAPRQQLIDPALLVSVDDGGKRYGQIGQRIDSVKLAGLNERGDYRPVLCSRVMSCKECVLAIGGNRPDGPLDTVVVDLNAAVGQERLQTIPVFGDVCQCLAERGLRCNACAVMDKPVMQASDEWR